MSDTICVENGYSIIANPKRRGKSYDKWQGGKPPCQRDQLRAAIDAALAQKPDSLDAFINLLERNGIQAEWRGKSLRLKTKDGKRFIRLDADSMGEDYALDALLEVLSGKRTPPAGGRSIKVNLLVDIQAKLRAGKGAGYERWARVFNLKQMAQTLNYLTDHDLLAYEDLTAKAAAVSEKYNELSGRIKDAEKRMAEIAVLKKHIINYAKTRNVYAAYRKAGYSKKFKAEHESDILLHQAAKKAFDGLGMKKLPTVKSLQAEYAALLAEKKAAYAAYREARGEMKELLTVKANVDRILGRDGQEPEPDTIRQTPVGER